MFFFFNDTATTEIYTLSLHDALPILLRALVLAGDDDPRRQVRDAHGRVGGVDVLPARAGRAVGVHAQVLVVDLDLDVLVNRSEEHTSELQSRQYLVCRLLLEKKKSR